VGIEARHAELKPLVTALDDQLRRLRHKVERELLFVANAAHELCTPLAVITAQAHTLVKAGTATEQVEAQSRLNCAIERAPHLIRQLLAVMDQPSLVSKRSVQIRPPAR
jgi:two-component system sensor histidine kinase QseC